MYSADRLQQGCVKSISKGAVLQKPTETLAGKEVMDTDYADDMGLLDNTKDGLQETTDLLCKFSAYAGLRVNASKTKVMSVGKGMSQRPFSEQHTLETTVEGTEVQQVSDFTYLGSNFEWGRDYG